jgi:hypothetical protein
MPRHPNQKPMAGKGFSEKDGLGVSWWLASAQPDQRAQFIVDAKIRHERRLAKYRAVYTNAAGEVDR